MLKKQEEKFLSPVKAGAGAPALKSICANFMFLQKLGKWPPLKKFL